MACTYINPKTKNELALSNILREYYKLDDSKESSQFLDSKIKMFFTDDFKQIFGDWINEDKELFGNRVNEFGEPNLYKDGENFYVYDLNNEKYFINNRRFEGLEQYEGLAQDLSKLKEEGTSKIVNYIFTKYKNKDEDITDLENISFNLEDEVDNFFKDQIKENPYLEEDMSILSQFKEDFVLEVKDYLNNINIVYNEDPDTDDQSYQDSLEDNGAVVGKSSIEKNSKDNATVSVKLMMSLIPDINSESEFFTGYKLLPFSKIWNDVQKTLSDVPKIMSDVNGNVVDPYSIMISRLNKMAITKPYIQGLIDILETSSKNLQTQFVQAFANNGKYIQDTLEIDPATGTYSLINAAESSSKKSKLLIEAGLNFKSLFTTLDTKSDKRSFDLLSYEKFRKKYLDLQRNEKETKGLLIQLKNIQKTIENTEIPSNDKILERDRILKDIVNLFSEIITNLGFPLTGDSLNYFLSENGKLREPSVNSTIKQIEDFVISFNYIDKFLIPNINLTNDQKINVATDKLFDKSGKYLNIYKGEKNQITSQKVIENIAEAIGFFNTDLNEDMFFSGDKQMWVYSQTSHLYDVINILNNDPKEVEKRLSLSFTKNSKYLKLYQEGKKLKIHRTNSMMEKDKASESKDNVNTSKTDAINREIFEALLGKKHNANSIFPTAIAADKPTTLKLEVPNFIESRAFENEDGEIQLSEEVLDIFTGYFEDELLTALEAKKFIADNTDSKGNVDVSKLTQYKHVSADGYVFSVLDAKGNSILKTNNVLEAENLYQKNIEKGYRKIYLGGVFKNFTTPSLSPENLIKRPEIFKLFYNLDFTPILINELTEQQKITIKPILNKLLSNLIKDNIKYAVDAKVFRKSFAKNTFDSNLYKLYSENYDLKSTDSNYLKDAYKAIVTDIMSDYTINSTIAQIEFSKIFNGSINNHKNAVDYFKRVPKTYIDGKGLRLGLTEGDHNFNVTVLQDVETSSPYIDQMGEVGKKFYSGDKINQADAQAYITPARWKFLLERLGQFGNNEKKVWNKIQRMENGENVEFNTKELKTLSTKPLKGVYFSNENNNPVYLKYSQTVLLKSLVKGTPLEQLLNQMESQNISEAIMNSGVKVGAKLTENNTSQSILNLEKTTLNSIPLDNRFWKLQQDLPNKGFKQTLLGSQIQKNIFDNFNFEGVYKFGDKTYTGEEVYENIHSAIGEISNRGITKIVKKFQIDSNYIIRNWSQFSKEIADQLRKEKINENIIKAVEKELTPYVIPQAKDKILSTIMSIINKSAIKLKTNGGSLIQMSNFGLDQNIKSDTGIRWLIDPQQLAEPRKILQEDGTPLVIPGQCFISGNLLGQYIPNWREYSNEELFGNNGIFPKEILKMIGYRIPNQAMSSNDALDIVGILPDTYIDTIVPYTGITTKTGSDFDIDKMFIILPSFRPKYTNNVKLLNEVYKGKTISETTELLADPLDEFNIPNEISNEDIVRMMLSDKEDGDMKEIINFYRDIVLSNIFNNKKLSKEFRKINKDYIKVEKVEYIHFDENKLMKEQSTEAINNRLFEMYHSILTQPSNYDNLITPIDHAHIKDFITKTLFPETNVLKDYKAFSALYQVDMKYEFIAGSFGIGQVANQLVDSVMNQVSQERLYLYLGWGNYDEILTDSKSISEKRKVTVFDKKGDKGIYDEENAYKITDSLTALLNGFVDIAKDPYITRGNWNTQTTNTGAMLLRAGVHPYKVLSFLAQPSLVEMVNITSEREGILTKKGSSSTVITELKDKYLLLFKKSLISNGILKSQKDDYWNVILKDISNRNKTELNISEDVITTNKIQNRSLDILVKHISDNRLDVEKDSQYYLDQYLTLKEYERIKPIVKEFTKSVGSSKYGESGTGKSLIEHIIQSNKTSDVYYKNMIVNFDKKFFNLEHLSEGITSLGTFHKNTEVFMNNLINNNPKLFITGNDFFKEIMNEMSSEIHKNKKYLDDEEIGKIFEQSFYTMITSESKLFKMSDDVVKRGNLEVPKEFFYLFTKSNSITPVTISDLILTTKQELLDQGRNNFLLDNIEIKEDNKFVFIGIDGIRLKPNDFTEKLINAWRDLEKEYPALAEDLVKYAYQQSGFRYNANQIYQFIPHEYLIKYNFNNYINKIADEIKEGKIDPEIIKDNIYRHNWNNSKIVPFVNIKNMSKREDSSIALYKNDLGFRLSKNSNRHSGEGFYISDENSILTFPKFVNYNDNLYELEGYLKGEPIYFKTNKLGYRSSKGQLHEYSLYKKLNESNIKENNLTEDEKVFINKAKESLKDQIIKYEDVLIDRIVLPIVKSFNSNELVSDLEVEEEIIEFNEEMKEYSKILMQPDNIEKIKSGTKTITNRTELFNDGIYIMPDGTNIKLTLLGKAKADKPGTTNFVSFDTVNGRGIEEDWDKNDFAKSEGFKDWKDFEENNKFSNNFINGTSSRYIYSINLVTAVKTLWEQHYEKINDKFPDLTFDQFNQMTDEEQSNLIQCL